MRLKSLRIAAFLKYFHINTFYRLLRPYSKWTRKRRMQSCAARLHVMDGTTILDLGGQPAIWETIAQHLDLTILNLPGIAEKSASSHHTVRYVEGDACQLQGFADRSFDAVFSNSVIEHVGDDGRQIAFASAMRRLGRSYWVQTPSKWFPIEAHCGMPFWWFYPERLRRRIIEHWRKKLPAWTHMVEETRVLTKSQMRTLFPEAKILTERSLGLSKSYIAYFVGK